MKSCVGGFSKPERKTVEKNRRMHMKSLCFKLSSLVPKDHNVSKDTAAQQDLLDQAAGYIKSLKERIERLKRRKERVSTCAEGATMGMVVNIQLPVIEVRHTDLNLEVVLISGLEKQFVFHEVIGVLEEEGAEVVNANFSVVGDKIFHTIHSQAICSRIGLEAPRLSERLKELLH